MDHAEVLLIGGRAGVGKTTVGWEVSARLRDAQVAHAVIDGDFMGAVHPAPAGDAHRAGITERNLAAVWGNYASLGYRRLVYTNTVSVLDEAAPMFRRAMGDGVRLVRLLEERAPVGVVRVVTDGRSVIDIASEVVAVTGWADMGVGGASAAH